MPTIRIAKKHALSHERAKEIAENIARDLKRRFELDYAWEGDHVDFERPGVSGRMLVGRADISLDVHLGFLLTPLKPAIEREIHAQLDTLIEASPPPRAAKATKLAKAAPAKGKAPPRGKA